MKNQEAVEIIRRLKSIYPTSSLQNSEFLKEYMDILLPLDNQKALKTVEKIRVQCKFSPSIAEFVETYNKNGHMRAYENKDFCYICKNDGFVLYTKRTEIKDVDYQFPAYCNCEKGSQWAIDTGTYKTYAIHELYSKDIIDKIADRNRQQHSNVEKCDTRSLVERMRHEIQPLEVWA